MEPYGTPKTKFTLFLVFKWWIYGFKVFPYDLKLTMIKLWEKEYVGGSVLYKMLSSRIWKIYRKTAVGVSFLIMLQSWEQQLCWKRDS